MKHALPRIAVVVFLFWGAIVTPVSAQLFDNLKALGGARYPVGDPSVTATNLNGEVLDGPKDVAARDLDGDGKPDLIASDKDGSVTIRYGIGDGSFGEAVYLRAWTDVAPDARVFGFTNVETEVYCDYQPTNSTLQCFTNIFFPPLPNVTNRICLTNMTDGSVFCTNVLFPPPPMPPVDPPITNVFCQTNFQFGCVGLVTNLSTNVWYSEGPFGFRGLAVADFTGDGLGDIAVAAPGEQVIYLFVNGPGRQFAAPTALPGWFGVRDLATGDFDGDGRSDLVAAGTTNGVVQYRSLGDGTFQVFPPLTNLASTVGVDFDDFDFPQPAYYLKSYRYPGDTQDELVVSFAQRNKIWVLHADATGQLVVTGDVENVSLTSLDVGRILTPADSGEPPDLVTAYSRGGCLDIFPASTNSQRFAGQFVQRHYIPGAPRNVRIVDLDQDNWNDVVVVAQAYDRVLIYKNKHGVLEFTAETSSGRFPREMDVGLFNDDDRPDLAVLNRISSDISVFLTATNFDTPVGFLALDSIYPVDGSVSGLQLLDFNRDMRPDVMQLHRDTSEFSVRFTDPDGKLGPPVYYAITNAFNPAAQIAVDVNGDGTADMVSANLSGSVTVRLGLPDGTFGPEQTFHLPANALGGLFAIVPGDFDNDGKIDLAAGYLDCRVSFFKGDGTGGFTFIRTDPFIYEPRSMAAVDCDQDGDLDLVGGALTGSFVVVENKGDLFTTPALTKVEYPGGGHFDTNLRVVDQNNDGDPDLLFGAPGGFTLFLGGPGLTFVQFPINNGNNDPGLSGSTFVYADLDGDGDNDIASICSSNACLSIRVFTNNQFQTVLTVPVPITRYLATGDLDGDGFADLVGSGDVLWVALSSRRATNAAPAELLSGRASLGILINEVLAANSSVPLLADAGRDSDFVELYNASAATVSFSGWRMALVSSAQATTFMTNMITGSPNQVVVVTNNVVTTNLYLFPLGSVLLPRDHRVLVCSDRVRTAFHTGFNLPAQGGTVILYNETGAEVDRVVYPPVNSDQSYARYTDGARRFVVNNIPSPDSPNVDNGAVLPTLTLTGVDLETVRTPGVPLRFRAYALDDVGLVNVSLLWRRLDIPDNETKRVILFDDGMNEDGPGGDGAFLGVLNESLPAGAEIQFYLECTDITGQVESTPGNPRFVSPGQRAQMHALAIAVPAPALEISEVVADNVTGLVDEEGGRPDWVEIRNVSSQAISLGNVSLGPRLFGNSDRLSFTNRPSINPGEHLVIYADGKPNQGQLHAPFSLKRLGEQLHLVGNTASGARFVIDSVRYGPQVADQALTRMGPGGIFVANTPTPRTGNVVGPWQVFKSAAFLVFAFPTTAGTTYVVEGKASLEDPEWTQVAEETSVGAELVIYDTMQPSLFLRVREK